MINNFKLFLLGGVFFTFSSLLYSQNNLYSPLSGLGIGQLEDQSVSVLRSMGSAGTAYHSQYHTNIRNVAALGRLKTASMEVGLTGSYVEFQGSDGSTAGWSGNLDYLTLAVPIFNPVNDLLNREQKDYGMGIMLGIKPFSNLGYNVTKQEIVGSLAAEKSFQGEGGSYQLMFGTGFNYKETSLGVRLEYIFGSYDYIEIADFPSLVYRYQTTVEESTTLKSFNLNIGLQHRFILSRKEPVTEGVQGAPKRTMTVGLTYSPNSPSTLTTNRLVYRAYGVSLGGFYSTAIDTFENVENLDLDGTLPGDFSLGLYYQHNEKLSLLMDVQYGFWDAYKDEVTKQELMNTFRIGGGLSYRPSTDNFDPYFSRVSYRIGGYYGTDPRHIDNEQLTDYGLTAGFTFPFVGKRRLTYGNLMLKYGRRGISGGISERYFSIGIGFTATDNNWFVKPKYE